MIRRAKGTGSAGLRPAAPARARSSGSSRRPRTGRHESSSTWNTTSFSRDALTRKLEVDLEQAVGAAAGVHLDAELDLRLAAADAQAFRRAGVVEGQIAGELGQDPEHRAFVGGVHGGAASVEEVSASVMDFLRAYGGDETSEKRGRSANMRSKGGTVSLSRVTRRGLTRSIKAYIELL